MARKLKQVAMVWKARVALSGPVYRIAHSVNWTKNADERTTLANAGRDLLLRWGL